MTSPLHDIADQLRTLADDLTAQADQVALGTYTVGTADAPPEDDPPATSSKSSKS